MRQLTFAQALDEAVAEEMRRDERVITLGTDFTGDPIKEFGPQRVRFTPISESAITGMGLGAAGSGYRPIVNWRMVTFCFVAMDQIVNQASKIRYMFGGQADFPVTYRCTTGGGMGLAAQHSHSLEGWYAHIPGLRIVAPATIDDARGMLAAALRCPDPVLIFEHRWLMRKDGIVPEGFYTVPLGKAAVARSVFGGPPPDIDQLVENLSFAGPFELESGRVAVRLAVLTEMIETGVMEAGAPRRLRIHLLEVLHHGLRGSVEAVQVQAVEADLRRAGGQPGRDRTAC